jgi:DNA-binding response OmpR family regulator
MPTPTPPVPSILVVDDDPNVRLIAARILGGWGFRVREAETAEEAFAVLLSEPDRPQLILIDVVLPGADGVTLAGQVREEWPDQRVLYMSAYPAEILRARRVEEPVLVKPFTQDELLRQVEAALTRKPGEPVTDAPHLPF